MSTLSIDATADSRGYEGASIDRTKTEHVGIVDRVIWSDDERRKVIVALTDGRCAIGPGEADQFEPETQIRFLGRWEDSPKHGLQFKFSTFVVDSPLSRRGQIAYLVAIAPNVGQSTAEKLCDKYGREAVRTLRERPELVAADGVMKEDSAREASEALQANVRLERTKIDLFELFKGRGFGGTAIDAAIKKWGAKAPRVIRRNPFGLMIGRIPGAGFKRCDKLYGELGLPLAALKRQFLCGWSEIRSAGDGHTWHRGESFVDAVRRTVPGETDPVRAIKLGIRAGWLRRRRDEANQLWLAEAEKAIAEQTVADRVRVLSAGTCKWPAMIPVSQAEGDGLPSQHQHNQVKAALARPFGVLAGSPGTGKTFSLAFVLREIISRFGADSVAVCAPTGKAAVRATQSLSRLGIQIKATTIHRLLEVGRNGHDGDGWGFVRNADNPLSYRFVIVDESSMIDASLLASLLSATTGPIEIPAQEAAEIPAGEPIPPRCLRCKRVLKDPESWKIGYGPECRRRVKPEDYREVAPVTISVPTTIHALPAASIPGTHVLLVGDPYQLAPVGHGAPLRDLIASGVAAYGELTEIRRNAGLIVEACRDIKSGQRFESAERIDMDAGMNLKFIETRNEGHTLEMIATILQTMTKFDPVWQTQILTALNEKSRLGRVALNNHFRGLLNPGAPERMPMWPGDKVICLRNCRVVPHSARRLLAFGGRADRPDHYQVDGDEQFLANGEIGRVLCVDQTTAIVRFRDDQPDDELVAKIWLPKHRGGQRDPEAGTMEQFDLAYAITTHKSQGSESPCVIVVADPAASLVAGREWWYTAISRAARLCLIVGQAVVYQQCQKIGLVKRKTFLVEELKKELS